MPMCLSTWRTGVPFLVSNADGRLITHDVILSQRC